LLFKKIVLHLQRYGRSLTILKKALNMPAFIPSENCEF
jgi:hypothetical protein